MRVGNENQAQYTPLLNACCHTYAILSKIKRKASNKTVVISGTLHLDFNLNLINLIVS
jgi:hypothetical protein